MNRKNNYNPFKMWGSYAGIILGFFIFNIIYLTLVGFQGICSNLTFILGFSCVFSFILIIPMSLGFLLGWGIHSLFRRFKK